MRTLERAVRALQLYEGRSPAYARFVDTLRASFAALWQELPSLTLTVQENLLLWEGEKVYEGQQRAGDLAFLFFRDGIRELTFTPGFEHEDLEAFLSLLIEIQRIRDDEDDLITLFWHHPFANFAYRNVEVAVDGLDAFTRVRVAPQSIDPARVRADPEVRHPSGGAPDAGAARQEPEMREALYLLDPAEFAQLRAELDRELARDLMRDVLHGLLDRLQDGTPERQTRIVRTLTNLLPGLLSSGRFHDAALILPELQQLASRQPPLPAEALDDIRLLFQRLTEPTPIRELVRTLEDDSTAQRIGECAAMLRHFPPGALEPLLLAAQSSERPEVQRTLFEVAERFAGEVPGRVVALLGSASPQLAAAAARLVARLGTAAAAPALARLLERKEPTVRLAAVAALQELRVSSAAGALQNVLEDADREVRIAAARALGGLRYAPARARLEGVLQSRRLRDADITERLAYFEAYASVAGAAGVEMLDRILNGKSWTGRREPAEMRASAALALARIGGPTARAALARASNDPEMVVRTAVARGMRREAS